jgi:hypothetical protein
MIRRSLSWPNEEVGFSGRRRNFLAKRRTLLDRFSNQARTQTASAHPNTPMALADHGTNGLDIRIEHSPGLIVGVTDIVAGYGFLLANLTL